MEYARSLRIEEWMDQQEIGSDELICACNDHQAIKRRKARYVLFKQLALEEIDKRCQKYKDDLLPGEKQAIEQAKELFSRGNYCAILVEYNFLGTFYTPLTFLAFINPQLLLQIMLPFSYITYLLISSIRAKDSRKALYNYFAVAMGFIFLPFALMDIVYITLFFPFVLIMLLLIELLMIVSSFICLYGFCFLSRYGVLHYRFKISMFERQYMYTWTARPPASVFVRDTIHHVPFRRLYRRPVLKIFHDMNVECYGFGEINGQVVTQDGINCYNRYYNYV